MGIDYGKKRVGIAVSDPLKIIATGLDTIPTPEIFKWLISYSQEEPIEAFVVGAPVGLDGLSTDATPLVQEFVNGLKKRFPKVAIHLVDERMTSVEAKKIILKSGVNKKKRRDKSLVDKVSAVLILQDFMESTIY